MDENIKEPYQTLPRSIGGIIIIDPNNHIKALESYCIWKLELWNSKMVHIKGHLIIGISGFKKLLSRLFICFPSLLHKKISLSHHQDSKKYE
nr:hypothetical protein Iba_chr11aCG0090 [Ipomoea batatas]GME19306.1 hypothetical protein Iba_scaffold22433CG0050 [Ipomoea batatas]